MRIGLKSKKTGKEIFDREENSLGGFTEFRPKHIEKDAKCEKTTCCLSVVSDQSNDILDYIESSCDEKLNGYICEAVSKQETVATKATKTTMPVSMTDQEVKKSVDDRYSKIYTFFFSFILAVFLDALFIIN